MKKIHSPAWTIACLVTIASLALTGCVSQPIKNGSAMESCISLPATANAAEKSGAAKLSASLIGKIGTPALEGSYKNAANSSYAQLSQKTLDQLVVAQFLVCLKKHHSADLSPETVASLENSLRIAVARAAGARSLSGPLSQDVKQQVLDSPMGAEKLQALQNAGL